MGSPEIPDDGDNFFGDEQNSNLPMHGVNFITTSDESDGENINNMNNNNHNDLYVGYQPLSMTGDNDDALEDNDDDDDDDDGDDNSLQENINPTAINNIVPVPVSDTNNNNSNPPDADAEIEAEIWSGPRPQVLSFELDSDKTQQIITAMSKITLPLMNVPDWANNVTEEKWKEDLLHRIRQRQQEPSVVNNNNTG